MRKSKVNLPPPLGLFHSHKQIFTCHCERALFSNYGTHESLTDDGLTEWHPAFLALGKTLDECANKYRKFCHKYKPKPKSEKSYSWGSKMLPKVIKGKRKKVPDGQMTLPWDIWEVDESEIHEVAEKFIQANRYNPRRQ